MRHKCIQTLPDPDHPRGADHVRLLVVQAEPGPEHHPSKCGASVFWSPECQSVSHTTCIIFRAFCLVHNFTLDKTSMQVFFTEVLLIGLKPKRCSRDAAGLWLVSGNNCVCSSRTPCNTCSLFRKNTYALRKLVATTRSSRSSFTRACIAGAKPACCNSGYLPPHINCCN